MHLSFFIHSSVDGHLSYFHILAIVNSAAVNIGYMCLFQLWFSQGICPVVGLLGHMLIIFLVFKRNFILSSIVVVSICIPTPWVVSLLSVFSESSVGRQSILMLTRLLHILSGWRSLLQESFPAKAFQINLNLQWETVQDINFDTALQSLKISMQRWSMGKDDISEV